MMKIKLSKLVVIASNATNKILIGSNWLLVDAILSKIFLFASKFELVKKQVVNGNLPVEITH